MKLQELCERYQIRFKKQLGQNLLLDDNINRIMVEAASLTKDDDVVEVGAGLGALTEKLHPLAGRVFAIEIDRSFMPCLEDRFGEIKNVVLFRGDVLNHPVEKLLEEFIPGGARYKLVSNLPYYITTPILFHFWESAVPFERVVVMVQEEVALRMVAPLGARDYGVLTLAAALHGRVDIVHKVPRTCFRPTPNVDSCIVRLRRHASPLFPGLDPEWLMRVIRAAFAQRRKTLLNTLSSSGDFRLAKDAVQEAIESAGLDPRQRAQTVSLDNFANLARALEARTAPRQ